MQKKTIYGVFVAVLLVAVSFGFYKIVIEDPTTAVSFSTYRSAEQTPVKTSDNPLLGTWTVGLPIPSPGSNGGAGVGYSRNDTAWMFSVNGDIDGSGGAPGQFRLYNITTNTWTPLPNYTGRAWTSAGKIGPVANTNIYVLGGMPTGATAWNQMTGTLQKYSINTNTWTTMAPAPIPTGSSGVSGYQDSLLYSVGGQSTSGNPHAVVQLYNQTSNTWRAATPLPAARGNGWMVIKSDTIYYGCGAGPTTATFNNNIYVGVINQSDRSMITWTTSPVTYPGVSRHRMDASEFGCKGMIIGPGAGASWWGTGNDVYTWNGGASAFVNVGPIPAPTSDVHLGTAFFQRGSYRVWKAVIATGLIMAAPYHILNTQIYTDSCLTAPPTVDLCEQFSGGIVPPTGWTLTGAALLWSYNAVSGYGFGTGSAKADFYNVGSGNQQLNSIVFTPSIALDTLKFQNAYCTFTTENDKLQILTSTNGGTNYTQLVMLNGGVSGELVSSPPQTASFTPTAAQWKRQKFALPIGTNRVQFNAISAFGNNLYIDSICVKHTVTGISTYEGIPKDYALSQNYPNPFNPVTKINFALPKSGFVSLKIYDMLGREVRTLVNEVKSAGNFSIDFNASELSSGIYFYRLETNGFSDIKKMMLIK